MRFYTGQHEHYCGIDLHARTMYLCILDSHGETLLHRNVRANPDAFLDAIEPFRGDLVVGVECMFTWYWLADVCNEQEIPFVLGHALYMKAIHGGKSKNDRIDAYKIAALLRGGNLPQAYVYPADMRPTRDLLRRRLHLVRKRAALFDHIKGTANQFNLPSLGSLQVKKNRAQVARLFLDPIARRSIELDLELIDTYDPLIRKLEYDLKRTADSHDRRSFLLLKTIPGIGQILGMTILYEIHDIHRFPRVQDFCSYCRLIGGTRESAGKPAGFGGQKIGNVNLKWAFSEATILFLAKHPAGKKYKDRLATKHGKAKAMAIVAHKLGRVVYHVLKRGRPFDPDIFPAAA